MRDGPWQSRAFGPRFPGRERRTPAPKRRPLGFVEPCIPIRAPKPPVGPQWIHEIKHDGYRLRTEGLDEMVRQLEWCERLHSALRSRIGEIAQHLIEEGML